MADSGQSLISHCNILEWLDRGLHHHQEWRSGGCVGGDPLAPGLRAFFERAFGQSLNEVRIHCGGGADVLNRRLGSVAFVRGSDIFFRRGAFAPWTRWGLWLLAHELAHVLQQRGSTALHVAPCWAATLEREADHAACAVLEGRAVEVPPRFGCPSIQPWGPDMHFLAVYWAGRMVGAEHREAVRAALASESLDDDASTAAPQMKIRALGLREEAGRDASFTLSQKRARRELERRLEQQKIASLLMTRANNSHALGVKFEKIETVAKAGIIRKDDLLFGLGLHTVGDFLPHANLSGIPTCGHQFGFTETRALVLMLHNADFTSLHPEKAKNTFAWFAELWAQFKGAVPQNAPRHAVIFEEFLRIEDDNKKGKSRVFSKIAGVSPKILVTDVEEVARLYELKNDADRHAFFTGKDTKFTNAGEGAAADRFAGAMWEMEKNDELLRSGKDDISRAQNKWANLGQSLPPSSP